MHEAAAVAERHKLRECVRPFRPLEDRRASDLCLVEVEVSRARDGAWRNMERCAVERVENGHLGGWCGCFRRFDFEWLNGKG